MISATLKRLLRSSTPEYQSPPTCPAILAVAEPMEGRVLMSATGLDADSTALATRGGGETLPHESVCFSYAKIEY